MGCRHCRLRLHPLRHRADPSPTLQTQTNPGSSGRFSRPGPPATPTDPHPPQAPGPLWAQAECRGDRLSPTRTSVEETGAREVGALSARVPRLIRACDHQGAPAHRCRAGPGLGPTVTRSGGPQQAGSSGLSQRKGAAHARSPARRDAQHSPLSGEELQPTEALEWPRPAVAAEPQGRARGLGGGAAGRGRRVTGSCAETREGAGPRGGARMAPSHGAAREGLGAGRGRGGGAADRGRGRSHGASRWCSGAGPRGGAGPGSHET